MDVRKADNPERLKDLRVVDKHLTLEQLAEQTGLSKSALGKYETDDYKDISPFAIATLADFYGVSTDYLMGLTENKNHPNTELQSLHLSDDMVELLSSGKINNRLLCELATHPEFPAADDRYGNLYRPDRQYAGGADESGVGGHPADRHEQVCARRR